ncbi:hypothetical protein F7725_006012 [Dissostichus mawsoni]|uniref:Uncharacterized protein n=1 Tax=Dissostichus mawsoni TaxID=36200 RepID=A0A7J5YT50_DISMA|nr:hypothetical protein F7725_006012 [Dissostichus mawsoni]
MLGRVSVLHELLFLPGLKLLRFAFDGLDEQRQTGVYCFLRGGLSALRVILILPFLPLCFGEALSAELLLGAPLLLLSPPLFLHLDALRGFGLLVAGVGGVQVEQVGREHGLETRLLLALLLLQQLLLLLLAQVLLLHDLVVVEVSSSSSGVRSTSFFFFLFLPFCVFCVFCIVELLGEERVVEIDVCRKLVEALPRRQGFLPLHFFSFSWMPFSSSLYFEICSSLLFFFFSFFFSTTFSVIFFTLLLSKHKPSFLLLFLTGGGQISFKVHGQQLVFVEVSLQSRHSFVVRLVPRQLHLKVEHM